MKNWRKAMSNLDKYQQSNADNDISLAWNEFQKRGEIENNAESVLFAAEYYQTQCKTITKQRDELLNIITEQEKVIGDLEKEVERLTLEKLAAINFDYYSKQSKGE